jgi:benzoate membrane transport protein
MRASLFSAALVASLVGYGSTIALVLAAAAAVGATPEQTASWVVAVSLAKAAGSLILSVWTRIPVVLAWSTPGAALVAATTGLTMPEAVGAFILAGTLVVLTGLIRPLGRLVAMIPDGIAAGMLAGVLLPFVLRLAQTLHDLPVLVGAMAALFLIVRLWNPALAVLAALALGLGLAFGLGTADWPALSLPWPQLTFVAPEFRTEVLLGLGVPLYLVTMASQNLPGFATLRAAGYEPPVRKALVVTGGLSALTALWGAHTVSMAAITAAICLGDDVHPDKKARWRVGVVYAGFWTLLAVLGPVILLVFGALPPELMAAIVALALLAPLTGAIATAMAQPERRFAATVTITVTASGVAAFGIGAAFWGLLAGLAVHLTEEIRRNTGAPRT